MQVYPEINPSKKTRIKDQFRQDPENQIKKMIPTTTMTMMMMSTSMKRKEKKKNLRIVLEKKNPVILKRFRIIDRSNRVHQDPAESIYRWFRGVQNPACQTSEKSWKILQNKARQYIAIFIEELKCYAPPHLKACF